MFKTVYLRMLLPFAVSLLLGILPARAAENDGLTTDFGGFGSGGIVVDAPLTINDMVILPDGKIIAVGVTNDSFAVARYGASGVLDASFGTNGLVVTKVTDAQQRAEASGVVVQLDGKFVVAGTVYGPSGGDVAVLRFLPKGALDLSFGGDGKVVIDFSGGDDSAATVALDGNNRIVVGGSARVGTQSTFAALRLTNNGTLDASFDGNGKATVDFGGDGAAADLLIQPKGEIVLAGRATVAGLDGEVRTREALARLMPTGAPDLTFDKDGRLVTEVVGDAVGSSVALDYNGKLVVAGSGADAAFLVARYNPNGTPDTTFGVVGTVSTPFGNPDTKAAVVLTLPDGNILAAGQSAGQMAFARYSPNGTLDQSLDGDGKLLVPLASAAASSVVLAADGRLLAAGGPFLTRLFADGTLDAGGRQLTSFGLGTGSEASTTLVQPDGKIVSVGTVVQVGLSAALALTRHLPDGQLDPSFGSGGVQALGRLGSFRQATDALLQPQGGKLLVIGSVQDVVQGRVKDADLLIAQFNPDGSPDTTCGDAGLKIIDVGGGIGDEGHSVALQADGKLLVAGVIMYPNGNRAFVLRLASPCGLPDPTFGNGGLVELPGASAVVDVLALPEGGVQLIGTPATGGVFLARLRSSDGGPDDNFGPPSAGGNVVTPLTNGMAQVAALLPDGKLLVGAAQFTAGQAASLLLRYTASGALDPSFGTQGVLAADLGSNGVLSAIALRGDGAFALAGCGGSNSSAPVALFNAAGALDPSFGDGGKAALLLGGFTCVRDATFSGQRLLVGGFAQNGTSESFALAAYATGGQPREVAFASAGATVAETGGAALLTVRLSQTTAQTVTVEYAATGGTATNGADYTLPAGTLTFAPGQTAQRISLPISNDAADEGDETVTITLSSPSNAVLGSAASFTLTIADDGGTPPPGQRNGVFLPLVLR